MYKIRGPDGLWIQKGDAYKKLKWTTSEETATFWKKLSHVKNSRNSGVLSDESLALFLEGLPVASLQVVEYIVDVKKTRRYSRLTEINNFTEENE